MMRRHKREMLIMDSLLLGVLIFILLSGPLSHRSPTGQASSLGSQVFVTEAVDMTCNVTLIEGWNLAATHCEPYNGSIDDVLLTINDSVVSVHTYWGNESLDYWKAYNPSLPNWTVQDLSTITRTLGYWIRVTQNDTITHNGTWYSPTIITMGTPVTLSGYPTNTTYPVNLSIEDINNSVDAIYLYNASDSSDPWKVFVANTNPSLNDLTELEPYHGLWFKMFSNTSWMVIWE